MEIQNRFRRYELKYLMTADEYEAFFRQAGAQVRPDAYGKTGILNLYYDTPDYRIIRRSLEKPVYKEKLRLRSYGVPGGEDRVFPELKKKYRSVVYKRREAMTLTQAEDFLAHPVPASQIMREIAYFLSRYEKIQPRMFLSYRREALYDSNDPGLRITFDTDIRWRTEDLDLRYGAEGTPLLPPDVYLMEVKTATALPLWLVNFLTEQHIQQTSFSKYGKAYTTLCAGRALPAESYLQTKEVKLYG